jgi:NAD(P)-dependent dehydrogenase (short-subunit alcohol dehydrogenase family)
MIVDGSSVALIVGAGEGLSASLARKLAAKGARVVLASRTIAKLSDLAKETSAETITCDASNPDDVTRLFDTVRSRLGVPHIVIYNASGRLRGPVIALDSREVARSLAVTAYGGFLVGQQAAKAMMDRGSGVILFTGASASIKGFAQSAPFAMGKFALRGLAQSMARELGPKGIHVAHVIIDGAIRSARNPEPGDPPDSRLDPDAIAETYMSLIAQSRSAWTHELEVRPWIERF